MDLSKELKYQNGSGNPGGFKANFYYLRMRFVRAQDTLDIRG
jgi:hypothetical protein